MRRVRFRDSAGSVRDGEVIDGHIEAAGRTYSMEDVDVLPPVNPSKVIGVGFNYRHRVEEKPDYPFVWWKGDHNVLSGHRDTVTIPDPGEVIFEAELGVVIGEQCRNVSQEDALDVVEGFTCVNDLTDLAHEEDDTMLRIKSFDNSAPMGPVVATPDHVSMPPRIQLWINGDKRQDTKGHEFVFSVREAIAIITERMTLEPEDVVLMGNPGDASPLTDGDTVEIEIEGVGKLVHETRVE